MLAALCGPLLASGLPWGLPFGLLLAGLAGSTMHCAPMCGPFVLGQVSDRLARVPAARLCEMSRLGAALLLPYHVGRLTTYTLIGAASAGLGGLPWLDRLAGPLLLFGALLFLLQAAGRIAPALRRLAPGLDRAPPRWVHAIGALTQRIDRTRWTGGLMLGLALGFLPCGFLYAAIAIAASTGSAGAGALAMLAFGLGTVPSLVVVGLAGRAAGHAWQRAVLAAAPVLMFANGTLLAVLALQRLGTF
nr:sulfite exporter TauE/SafE family protein [Limobrevibacterium gyesilva]